MDCKRPNAATTSAGQLDRFKETARALGCDESEAAFDEKLRLIARSHTTVLSPLASVVSKHDPKSEGHKGEARKRQGKAKQPVNDLLNASPIRRGSG